MDVALPDDPLPIIPERNEPIEKAATESGRGGISQHWNHKAAKLKLAPMKLDNSTGFASMNLHEFSIVSQDYIPDDGPIFGLHCMELSRLGLIVIPTGGRTAKDRSSGSQKGATPPPLPKA